MTLEELYMKIKANYETMISDISMWEEEYGESYEEKERMYDEGYANALYNVLNTIKEA